MSTTLYRAITDPLDHLASCEQDRGQFFYSFVSAHHGNIMALEEPDFEKYKRHFEELAKTVSVKNDHIVINVHYEYNIALSSCDTHEKILGWVFHLTEKTWMSRDVLRRFILVACHESGLEVPHS